MVAVGRTLFRDAETRRPVPGMSALYGALLDSSEGRRAFWYLSTGSWAMYEVLTDFLRHNGFPDGPLLLTDWGANERYVIRSGREHKRTSLRRLLADLPGQRVVLIGDSGEGDAEVYEEVARDDPARIAAIVVLDVGEHRAERAEELRTRTADLAEEGIAFHLVADAAGAAEVLADAGLLPHAAIATIRTAQQAR
jgi:phosphatidate phosphatase APP1